MVKVIRFFCLFGIAALLAIFVGYTEFETKEATKKELTEIENQKEKNGMLETEYSNDSKTNLVIKIFQPFL